MVFIPCLTIICINQNTEILVILHKHLKPIGKLVSVHSL